MKMDAGLDTGDMLTKVVVPIAPQDNSETLHDRLAEQGAELLVNTIPRYVAGAVQPQKQPAEGVTYARKITKEDGHLNWNLPANDLWNRLRALTPWPGAFTHLTTDAGKRMLKIWEAEVVPAEPSTPGQVLSADKHGIVVACGQSALRIKTIQREGGRRLSAHDYLVGHPLSVGTMLA
jgi:methionyl-tRNA formyltransferase